MKTTLYSFLTTFIVIVMFAVVGSLHLAYAVCLPQSPGYCDSVDQCPTGAQCVGNCCNNRDTGGDPWTCFPAGTKVLTASGVEKNIEDVVVGDRVVSQSEQGTRSVSTVTQLDQPVRDHMCRLSFADGDSLRLTDEHPLFTQAGWKAIAPGNTLKDNPTLYVQPMVVGDTVAKADGSWAQITNIACWSEKIQAYNLILGDGAHTYFADDYLAHNKGGQACVVGTVNCPAGTEIDYTQIVNATCDFPGCGHGSAQATGACCGWFDPPQVCGDWYACPTPNNPDKMCRDCTDEPPYCEKNTVTTYGCKPICAAVAPTITITQTNDVVTVSWTPRTGATSYLLRVDEDLVEVNGGCGTPGVNNGWDCEAKETLPGTASSYQLTNLTPGTPYYFRVVDFVNGACYQSTVQSFVPQTAPACTSAAPESLTTTSNSGTFYAYAYGITNATNVRFAVWSSVNGQDDLVWYNGENMGGGTWRAAINLANHPGLGTINVHVYMVNSAYAYQWCTTANFERVGAITGHVYDDVNSTCTQNPWSAGGIVSAGGGLTSPIDPATGQFTISASGATTYSLTLAPWPDGYVCSPGCGGLLGCPTITGVISPSQGNNFYLTLSRNSWWQAVGGPVYAGSTAGGTTVRSTLPTAASRLILPGAGGGTVAALLRASGTTSLGTGQVSDTGWMATTKYKGKTLNYDFFATQYGITSTTASSWGGNDMNQLAEGQEYYYLKPSGGHATITRNWHVTSGQKYVVFVNGDLDITMASDAQKTITVDEGGFLALIVNGNVTVDPAVTQLDGIVITDGSYTTNSTGTGDSQLLANGSTIAWGGVSLGRDLGGANVSTPAEKFTYRPDLLTNMPDKMKTFAMTWEEVVPGTIGN